MAYEPLNLQNGQVLTAEDVQHIEDGVQMVLPIVSGNTAGYVNTLVEYAKQFQPCVYIRKYSPVIVDALSSYQTINPFAGHSAALFVVRYALELRDNCGDAEYVLELQTTEESDAVGVAITQAQYEAIALAWEAVGWITVYDDGCE